MGFSQTRPGNLPQRGKGASIINESKDAELIARVQAGDVDAFEAIVVEYEPKLVRFIYGLTHERELAEDLVQETFVSAYRALLTAPEELKLSAWLYKIALNKVRSEKRRKRPVASLGLSFSGVGSSASEEDAPALDLPDPHDEPGEQIVQRQQILHALAQLPEDQATALMMDAQGFDDEEIALALEVSVGAVRQKLFRGRKSFRKLYE
ncbi:MAG TPA: sigma-70 family RNA polymerase sigma factor [Chloroflexia bacterium]|nr:sigma-70 family RNA polymerase sigma factor [Chloroflexia bacterium]